VYDKILETPRILFVLTWIFLIFVVSWINIQKSPKTPYLALYTMNRDASSPTIKEYAFTTHPLNRKQA